jgi:hypothetical protein
MKFIILTSIYLYSRYTVQISTKTAALPYADAFIPSVRYCITWVSASECQLTCYLGVRWVKSVLVRGKTTIIDFSFLKKKKILTNYNNIDK